MPAGIHVGILMGGPSREYEVSLESGKMIIRYIDSHKYLFTPVVIKKNASWALFDPDKCRGFDKADLEKWLPISEELSMSSALERLKKMGVDIFFNVMHGAYGEDGTIQGVLEAYGFPYTGSSVLASSLAMDKIVYKQVLKGAGISVPHAVFIFKDPFIDGTDAFLAMIQSQIGFPCVAKTPSSGSSIGVELCAGPEQIINSVKTMFPLENRVLIEQYISGREFTCGVLGNAYTDDLFALPPTEIISKNSFFDFDAKYTPGKADEITPAQIDKSLTARIQEMAVNVHNLLGSKGVTRTDMIVNDGRIFVLETNTIPGMTANSLVPKAAGAAGISLSELIDKLISYGLNDYHKKQPVFPMVDQGASAP